MNTNTNNAVIDIAPQITVVANNKTWLEDDAISQLKFTANLPHVIRSVGMPDLHPGRGYPIGAAFLTANHIYPALIGNDIGCGMGVWQTDLLVRKSHLSKMVKQLNALESALNPEELKQFTQDDDAAHLLSKLNVANIAVQGLGTIGRGNHFVELQSIDQIMMPDILTKAGILPNNVQMLVHSGSRGLGELILRRHVDLYSHQGLVAGTEAFTDYMAQHDLGLVFAKLNRLLIAKRFAHQLHVDAEPIFDHFHNYIEMVETDPMPHFVHRKGASPSHSGLAVIPGSRGDYSYLVQPNVSELLLNSIAHGAGRKWQRSHCKGNLEKRYTLQQLVKTKLGSHVVCKDKQLMYEEAPEAYKAITPIIDSLVSAGLITVVARLRPLITFKTNGDCC